MIIIIPCLLFLFSRSLSPTPKCRFSCWFSQQCR
jgi:hypothetical protein